VCRGNPRSDIAVVSLLDDLSDGTQDRRTKLDTHDVNLCDGIQEVEDTPRHDVQFCAGQLMHGHLSDFIRGTHDNLLLWADKSATSMVIGKFPFEQPLFQIMVNEF
jgi:hypothetical protein